MSGNYTLDAREFDRLAEGVSRYGSGAERVINDVLHNDAGPIIYEKVNERIHASGRRFKGHTASAKASAWPRYDTGENLAVSVGTKAKWHYLYFPDDGSNTVNHAGGQMFFVLGAAAASPLIVDACLDKLANLWKE